MKRFVMILVLAAAALAWFSPAEARGHKARHAGYASSHAHKQYRHHANRSYRHHYRYRSQRGQRVGSYGRPSRWCGWYMRTRVGADPGPNYNLARNWAGFGAPARGPDVGVIVVWRNHVGQIVGHDSRGQWLVHSGNDSNAVRTRARSLRGVIAYRWPAYRMAMR